MKYYLYVSDTKVDMLYSQIPVKLRDQLSTELKIDLKVISTTLSQTPKEENRYSKLALVTKYINEHEQVGSVDLPSSYLKGVIPISMCILQYENMVFFWGKTKNTVIGLGGSGKHIIGGNGKIASVESKIIIKDRINPQSTLEMISFSDFFHIMTSLAYELSELKGIEKLDETWRTHRGIAKIVTQMTELIPGPVQRLEVLAKTYYEGYEPSLQKRVVLGSPIYVALTD